MASLSETNRNMYTSQQVGAISASLSKKAAVLLMISTLIQLTQTQNVQPPAVNLENGIVRVDWRRSVIQNHSSYEIQFTNKDQITSYNAPSYFTLEGCSGTNAAIVAQKFCDIPLSQFTAASPLNLTVDQMILAVVKGCNQTRCTSFSDSNYYDPEYVVAVPTALPINITIGPKTRFNQLHLTWNKIPRTAATSRKYKFIFNLCHDIVLFDNDFRVHWTFKRLNATEGTPFPSFSLLLNTTNNVNEAFIPLNATMAGLFEFQFRI